MDLTAPYETVVPSLDGAVLEVLARTAKPVTGRQVQRLSRRGSVPGIAVVLERLTDSGIVLAERSGSAILYRANREHLAWPAVEVLVGVRQMLIERLSEAVAGWEHPPAMAILFGSAARGDGDTSSDVDILIVGAERSPDEEAVGSLRESIRRWTGNHAQVVVVSDAQWRRMEADGDPLVASVKRDGIDLLGALRPAA